MQGLFSIYNFVTSLINSITQSGGGGYNNIIKEETEIYRTLLFFFISNQSM